MNSIIAFVAGVGAAVVAPYMSHDALVFCAGLAVGASGCGYWYERRLGQCEEEMEVIENQVTDTETEQVPDINDLVVNEVHPEPTTDLVQKIVKDNIPTELSAYDLDTMQVSYTYFDELVDTNITQIGACSNSSSNMVHAIY